MGEQLEFTPREYHHINSIARAQEDMEKLVQGVESLLQIQLDGPDACELGVNSAINQAYERMRAARLQFEFAFYLLDRAVKQPDKKRLNHITY